MVMHGSFSDYVGALLAIHAAASAITALTKTPKDDTFVRRVYKIIELLALVTAKTKQR
jgi:hypothetical protein